MSTRYASGLAEEAPFLTLAATPQPSLEDVR
jgi:hypothetical protein